MLKDALFALGILIAISGWLLDAVSPESWIGHVVAPGYAPAMAGYRSLSRGRAISKHDRGFGELLEFATIEAPKIDRSQIDALHLGGLGIETAGISTHFELLGRDGRAIYARLVYSPTAAVREYFFDRNVRPAKALLFFGGITISVATYIVNRISDRRRRKLRVQ